MDELSNYLTSGKTHAKLSPESLEMMGKQAANMFLEGKGVSLNDAIAKLAGGHHDISTEQIKRVVEFANTQVYLAKHDQDKTAGAETSYPQFELADAGRIVQDLSDGARPTIVTQTDIDYNRLAKKEKVSSVQTERELAELFKTASEEKDYSQETIVNNVMGAKDALIGLRGVLGERYDQHLELFKEATAEFYTYVKRHILDGGSIGEVMAALKPLGIQDEVVQPVVQQLLTEKVAKPQDLKAQVKEASAHDGRLVDEKHPIIQTYAGIMTAWDEMKTASAALEDVENHLTEVQDFIKKAYFTKESIGGLLASLPMVGRAAGAVSRGRGLLGGTGTKLMAGVKKNPITAATTAASAVPQRQPAPVPPGLD